MVYDDGIEIDESVDPGKEVGELVQGVATLAQKPLAGRVGLEGLSEAERREDAAEDEGQAAWSPARWRRRPVRLEHMSTVQKLVDGAEACALWLVDHVFG